MKTTRESNPKASLSKRMVIMLVIVLILAVLLIGWGLLRAYFIGKFLKSFGNQVQTVATMTAQNEPWQAHIQSVGSIAAIQGASLSAETSGIVATINFQSGEDVEKGAVLLTLRANNDPALLAQLQAQAKLAAINYARDQKQYAAQAVSISQLDTDRATLDADNAQVAAQQALMAEKIVRAPFSGRLGIRQVNVGQYLPAGTEIVTLEQLDPLYVNFNLPQQALAKLKVGQIVEIGLDAYPGQQFPAKLTAIGATLDAATRSVPVQATMQNPGEVLRPGMFVTVKVDIGTPHEAITLPQTVISYTSYGDTVYVVDHEKSGLVARQVFVTTGATRGDQVQILSGIKAGEDVVTAGQVKLHNGAPVAINNSVQVSNNPNPNPPNE